MGVSIAGGDRLSRLSRTRYCRAGDPQGAGRLFARFSDRTFEFVLENGRVTALKQKMPSGEYVFKRK